jgi:hypothetical protein
MTSLLNQIDENKIMTMIPEIIRTLDNHDIDQQEVELVKIIRDHILDNDESLKQNLEKIVAFINQLPDFQPDITELFYALHKHFLFKTNSQPEYVGVKELSRSILASYSSKWIEAHTAIGKTKKSVQREINDIQDGIAKIQEKLGRSYAKNAHKFSIFEIIEHDDFKAVSEKIASSLKKDNNVFSLNALIAKNILEPIKKSTTNNELIHISKSSHYEYFKSVFKKVYEASKEKLAKEIAVKNEEISTLKKKLSSEFIVENQQKFAIQTLSHLSEYGVKTFYVRHAISGDATPKDATALNSHYQAIMIKSHENKGVTVSIIDSLAGKESTSPIIYNGKILMEILKKLSQLCFSSNTNDRLLEHEGMITSIFSAEISNNLEVSFLNSYQQTGTQCGIKCVDNLFIHALGKQAIQIIDFTSPVNEPQKEIASSLKRSVSEVGHSFSLDKYKALSTWAESGNMDMDFDEDLLHDFFEELSAFIGKQRADLELSNPSKRRKIEHKVSSEEEKELSIKDYKIECTDTDAKSFDCFKGNPPEIDLLIQLPTRGEAPDLNITAFLTSLSKAIKKLPPDERPKHIHLAIGVNGNDEKNVKENFNELCSQVQKFKANNPDQLPLSISVNGFTWSVTVPAGGEKFIPFGAIRNHLFNKMVSDRMYGKDCRFMSLDADISLNRATLKKVMSLKSGEYTSMPYQIPAGLEQYIGIEEAFELHGRTQREVGDAAYLSEPTILLSPKAFKALVAKKKAGVPIYGVSDCEGCYIDAHLRNSDCTFIKTPNMKSAVTLHNFKGKYQVENREITSRDSFISFLSSLAGQSENMSGNDFFAYQLARKYHAKNTEIVKAVSALYLPNLMRNGCSLNDYQEILGSLTGDNSIPLTEKQQSICDNFKLKIKEIDHPKQQVIESKILKQKIAILNFSLDKVEGEKLNQSLCNDIYYNSSPSLLGKHSSDEMEVDAPNSLEGKFYDREGMMPRLPMPENKEIKALKKEYLKTKKQEVSNDLIGEIATAVEQANPELRQLFLLLKNKIQQDNNLFEAFGNELKEVFKVLKFNKKLVEKKPVKKGKEKEPSTSKTTKRATWEETFKKLVAYKEKNGHCIVPNKSTENKQLAGWVNNQRVHYKFKNEGKKSQLTDKRIDKLKKIGFVWNTQNIKWDLKFKELIDYKKEYGNCNVPSQWAENKQLARWVNTQRVQYNLKNKREISSMTEGRIDQLEGIDFEWNAGNTVPWEKRFKELIDYKKEHGNCKVPSHWAENKQLARWVNTQREKYKLREDRKKSLMTEGHIEQLEGIGFEWNTLNNIKWDLRFEDLIAYKNEHGDCNVPSQWAENKQLARWVSKQRTQYKNKEKGKKRNITDERIKQLEEIGFEWNLTTKSKIRI